MLQPYFNDTALRALHTSGKMDLHELPGRSVTAGSYTHTNADRKTDMRRVLHSNDPPLRAMGSIGVNT